VSAATEMSAEEYNALAAAKKQRKYRNVRTVVDGIAFDSKAEAKRYAELRLMLDAGTIYGLRLQPRYPLTVNGVKVGTYVADFAYVDAAGDDVVEDVKGVRTPVFKLKAKLMKAVHGITVEEIG
jgi:hypothetical protein